MNILRQLLIFSVIATSSLAQAASANDLQTVEFTVDGVVRTALVYVPPTKPDGGSVPLVFAFHGHGGGALGAERTFAFDHRWPEAISVYPQGLNTPGMVSDPEGKKSGWQNAVGKQDDRDLHFFDAMLVRLKADYPVDPRRIYVTGHSNGAGFTYLLWHTRADVFAAVAPCSGAAIYGAELTPKPAIILGGRDDRTVKFEWQQMMIAAVRKINGCGDAAGEPWEGGEGTLYPSKTGTPLVTYLYDGGHMMEPGESKWIVDFFQQHPGTTDPTAGEKKETKEEVAVTPQLSRPVR